MSGRGGIVGTIMIVGAGALTLAGCFTSTADYRRDAETFIVEDAGIAESLGARMVSATCDEPDDQAVDTTFSCQATDENGETVTFEVTITESNRFVVSVSPTS